MKTKPIVFWVFLLLSSIVLFTILDDKPIASDRVDSPKAPKPQTSSRVNHHNLKSKNEFTRSKNLPQKSDSVIFPDNARSFLTGDGYLSQEIGLEMGLNLEQISKINSEIDIVEDKLSRHFIDNAIPVALSEKDFVLVLNGNSAFAAELESELVLALSEIVGNSGQYKKLPSSLVNDLRGKRCLNFGADDMIGFAKNTYSSNAAMLQKVSGVKMGWEICGHVTGTIAHYQKKGWPDIKVLYNSNGISLKAWPNSDAANE